MTLGPTVHIVDDDRAVLDALSLLFRADGCAVHAHASANAFLETINPDDVGCVVTDVRMPGVNGLELLAALKLRCALMPVIVMTAHGDIPLAVEAMRRGAVDFFEKPFDGDALLAAVRMATTEKTSEESRAPGAQMARMRHASLSKREQEVLSGLLNGLPNKMIAHELGISTRTVEVHRANVMKKMQAGSLSELVKMALSIL